ncbi:hypothetical protein K7X08_032053 [Anisodus acutangulus]|uniref:Uncharacterized protein n=1 Tax=Anisodus acutangulus TaxID=402998 RepID=A0A9Q1RNB3_9SOLA|nr:hypothetical protein K7X08_032053 [Anisodus acutangulus]
MVDESYVPPFELEYSAPNNQETGDAFNKGDEGIQDEPNASQTNPTETPAAETTSLQTPPTNTPPSEFSATNSSTPQTVASETSPLQTVAGETADPLEPLGLKEGLKREGLEERIPPNPDDVPFGEVEQNIGFDETKPHNRSLEERVGGDEPFYYSSEAYSCETNEDDGQERVTLAPRRESKYIKFDPSSKKVVWQLGVGFSQNAIRNRGAGSSTVASTTTAAARSSTAASTTGQASRSSTTWLYISKLWHDF